MESNEFEEKSQEKCNENKNPDCGQNVADPLGIYQEQTAASQTSSSRTVNSSLVKLTQRTKNICDKLAAKRHQLQLNEGKKEKDVNVLKALQAMENKAVFTKEYATATATETNLSNGVILNGDVVKPLNQHSKKQLASLVEGLQELLYRLTSNDKKLKSKAENIARNISGLKSFPLFTNVYEHGPSTSRARRQRHDSEFYHERTKRDSENSVVSKEEQVLKKKENKKEKLTPAENFVKYINLMLLEYFREYQDKKEMYMCSVADLEDLESFATSLVQLGIGRIVEAEIRINRKNNRQAFISISTDRDTSEKDGVIFLPVARHYAFEGDIVRAFVLNTVSSNSCASNAEDTTDSNKKVRKISSHITGDNSVYLAEAEKQFDIELDSLPESDNEETDIIEASMAVVSENCRKAFVIRIVKQTEMREVVGSINFMNETTLNSKMYHKLRPHDTRVPMVHIPKESCMEEIKTANKEDICGMLYVARVLETDVYGHCIGELVQPVGKAGNLQSEIKAILLHNGLKDMKPYEKKFLEMFEGPLPPPCDEDMKYREDLRKKCVFTIDPLTAKDLDDAVSLEKLSNIEYEIGVHISDVSFYLEENSELDNLVKHRATSIYLVNEVIHMLPPSLCFRCSLLPGEDKFAFSVFWKWHIEKQELSAPRFTRSIINSCTQFAYEHAQKIIDNPAEELDRNDLPDLINGWEPNDIKWRILGLHEIAKKLKEKRYENGALSINNPKLRFQLDPKTGEPVAYETEGRQEANFLIEEFMLLANQSVAKFIYEYFPNKSILRNHSPPIGKTLKVLKERLNNMGLEFDISCSKSIYESMQRLCREAGDSKAVDACLSALLTKPMTRACYFCSEGKTSDSDFWHYALSIPIYTHFTSPIRRYPDILVHRLLAAALNYCPPPQRTTDELHQLAKICNDQKLNAKNAGDESIELFFKRYVKAKQSITLRAVVTEIYKHMLNVVTIETGHTVPITYKLQKVLVDTTNAPSSVIIAEKNSQLPPIKLQLFSIIDINIVLRNEKICGFLVTPDIRQRRLNSKESSKRDKHLNSSNYAANGIRIRHKSNSISEQI